MASYKDLKEQFVTGFSGSTKADIGLICCFLPVIHTQLSLLLSSLVHKNRFISDFILLVVPIILSVIWTDYTELKLLLILIFLILNRNRLTNPFTNKRQAYSISDGFIRYDFISCYRSLLLIATCVSILAVDFPAYPRKFVKTEVKGVSLMDIGTGSVLFSSAFVARHARGNQSLVQRVLSAILSCLPLWVIGISKFFVHTAVDYQEHVSEYGVHWNFFMSLGVVVLFSAIISLPAPLRILSSGVIMLVYQTFLKNGLEDYILNSSRDNFISMNREGIFGCVGFFCIYQIGLGLKDYLLRPGFETRNICVAFAFFAILSYAIGGESRRLVIFI
jgi:glucosaminylphosphatidylinositol acyltransferase